jgi:hypothetical protein
MDDEDGFSTTPTLRDNPLLSFARDHVTLLTPVVAALIFAIRCVAVTNGDRYTASILIAQTSLGDAIRALLFSILPVLLLATTFLLLGMAGRRGRLRDLKTIGLVAISAATYLLSSYLGARPASLIAYVFLLIIVLLISVPSSRRREISTSARIFGLGVLGVVMLGALLGPITSVEFWLPPERLMFTGEDAFTGYVLKSDGDHVVVMKDNPRIIIEKPKSALRERNFCYPLISTERLWPISRVDSTGRNVLRREMPVCP